MRLLGLALLAAAALSSPPLAGTETKLLQDFEDEQELKAWEFTKGTAQLSDLHVSRGKRCLQVSSQEYLRWNGVPRDWSGFDALEADVFVEGEGLVKLQLVVGDADWAAKPLYWNRHNDTYVLHPGANALSISVNGLFRGEPGSRGNDLKTPINPAAITRLDFGLESRSPPQRVFWDALRLVRETPPEGVLAFDFGPPQQTVCPGCTPLSWNTVYGQNGNRAGLRRSAASAGMARDDTFPTRLYRDYVEMGDGEFVAAVPDGRYGGWLIFDDLGYWDGEACRHHRRAIENAGRECWSEDRGADGPGDYLFRFEHLEPKPGDRLWDLYMKELFKPARFEAQASDGQLSLRFKSDAPWSCKVAALVLFPLAHKTEAEAWLADLEARNRREFEARAAYLGPWPKDLSPPDEARQRGWWLGYPELEEEVTFADAPGRPERALRRPAARGQRVSFTFAVRPLREFEGLARLSATDLKGPAGLIPASRMDLRYVQHAAKRSSNETAYRIVPDGLRRVDGAGLRLGKDLTRQFWITLDVPSAAPAGSYSGEVVLECGALSARVPLAVEVLPWTLDEPDFAMGFYGTEVPAGLPEARRQDAWREMLALQKAHGMTSFTGGPNIPFSGLDAEGRPRLDFSACDAFFRAVKSAGFTQPIQSYGGPAMVTGLHGNYVIGAEGRNWEKKTGRPFKELLKLVWEAVRDHARTEAWPEVLYNFTDEPRVLQTVQEQLELMRAYREAVPFVKIGGSYSVHWGEEPLDRGIQEIFRTLAWSGLGAHGETDLAKAREYGKDLYVYNQGLSRFSFGAYQWAESHKGVKGRVQWHLLALHGYQFFDLDGREPDSAMLNWGRNELIPTLHLARCREGADDFRFAVTLWNLAGKMGHLPAAQAARAWLEDISKTLRAGQPKPPAGFMEDEAFRLACIAHLKKLLAEK